MALLHQRDLFIQKPDKYFRTLDVVDEATKTAALYLHLKSGKPLVDCENFITRKIQAGGDHELTPVLLKGLSQDENNDRKKSSIRLDKLLSAVKRNHSVLSPNMAVYVSVKVRRSPIAIYIRAKMASRKVVKRKGQEAEQLGDFEVFSACNNEEYAIKLLLNSISGGHASPYNPLFNESAHSTLTSTARVHVSYPNATTERFLMGNRHYWSKDVVIENILTIVRNTEYDKLAFIIEKYNLHIPTVDEVMSMIKRCTDFYWVNVRNTKSIFDLIKSLSNIQRVAYLYTGDFYSLYGYNGDLVSKLFDDFLDIQYCLESEELSYLEEIVSGANSGIASLASIYSMDFLKGTTVSKIKETSFNLYKTYANTTLHIELTLLKYKDLLVTLYRTVNVPSSIHNFPTSIRRAVVGSDTDSVMYTVQQQVIWRYGKLVFKSDVSKFTNTVALLNNAVIDHTLVVLAKQMGVDDEDLYTLRMKNEYEFLVYLKANRAKHYATLMSSKEGLTFKEPKSEIRGVGLKDSKIAKEVMKALEKELVLIMSELMAEGSIRIFPIMQRIANLEHLTYQSLLEGKISYLVGININAEEGYKNPGSSNYLHYDLWCNVFAEKFGRISEPPYRAVKISTIVDSKAKFKKWVETVSEDISIPLLKWMAEKGKDKFTQILLPLEIVSDGIPEDFRSLMDMRLTIAAVSAGHYIILEMLGFYFNNDHNTQLVSDRLPYRPEYGLPGETKVLEIINEVING